MNGDFVVEQWYPIEYKSLRAFGAFLHFWIEVFGNI